MIGQALLECDAVAINTTELFTYTSGKQGPVYVDIRRLISYPVQREKIIQLAAEHIKTLDIDVIAGGETAGIPFAAFLAQVLGKPMIYVRKKPKGFGKMNQIEGVLQAGQKVLLVEDLCNHDTSSTAFVDVLRQAGAICNDAFVVFNYGRPEVAEMLEEKEIMLHSLCSWNMMLKTVEMNPSFQDVNMDVVKSYLDF